MTLLAILLASIAVNAVAAIPCVERRVQRALSWLAKRVKVAAEREFNPKQREKTRT